MSLAQRPLRMQRHPVHALRPGRGVVPAVGSYLSFAGSAALALLAAAVVGDVTWLSAALIGAVVLTAVASIGLLPRYERARSWLPAKVVAAATGMVFFGAGLSGHGGQRDLRVFGVAAATYALTYAVGVAGHRLWAAPASALVLGSREDAAALVREHALGKRTRLRAVCLTDGGRAPEFAAVPRLPDVSAIGAAVTAIGINRVVLASPAALTPAALRRLSWQLESSGVELVVMTGVQAGLSRARLACAHGTLAISVRPPGLRPTTAAAKAVLDRCVGALLLVCCALPMLAVAALIRATSSGPALFRQYRAGKDGAPFVMFKFRTMTADAEQRLDALAERNEGAGLLFKMRNDPRVTRFGRLLRSSSIDELPQLLNVVRGNMSLIGPRPALLRETEQYDDWAARRLHTKPGMTGLWQVSGRSGLSWEESVRLDMDYVDNLTLAQDLSIAARTVRAVLRRDGAM